MPSYLSGSWPQVSHFHSYLLIGRALDHKSSIFIIAFLLVGLLTTSLPFSSLPSYWLGSCPQVSHFHPCPIIGHAFVHKTHIFILAFLLVGLLSTRPPFSSLLSYWHCDPTLQQIPKTPQAKQTDLWFVCMFFWNPSPTFQVTIRGSILHWSLLSYG